MKKICSIMLGMLAVVLSACQDTAEVRNAAGGYTYKTSGHALRSVGNAERVVRHRDVLAVSGQGS